MRIALVPVKLHFIRKWRKYKKKRKTIKRKVKSFLDFMSMNSYNVIYWPSQPPQCTSSVALKYLKFILNFTFSKKSPLSLPPDFTVRVVMTHNYLAHNDLVQLQKQTPKTILKHPINFINNIWIKNHLFNLSPVIWKQLMQSTAMVAVAIFKGKTIARLQLNLLHVFASLFPLFLSLALQMATRHSTSKIPSEKASFSKLDTNNNLSQF